MRKRVFLSLLILLVGCAQPKSPSSSPVAPLPNSVSGNPTATFPVLVIPKPDANTGVVVGQLVMPDSTIVLAGLPVYLGQILPVEPGPTYMITVQEKSSPHTLSAGDGQFALSAPPGEYIFMIWTPVHSLVITNPATKSEWKVTVRAGETTNAGKIVTEWP
jgi:hypothetical protein